MSATFSLSSPLLHGFPVSSTMMNSKLNSTGAFTFHSPFSVSGSTFAGAASLEATALAFKRHHQNPGRKRSKMMRIDDHPAAGSGFSSFSKQKYAKKPDPNAPKITRPCTECGKEFWSWKALFGHMRCHPERQWRGINPPPNLRPPNIYPFSDLESITEEEKEVAACLLLLATTPTAIDGQTRSFTFTSYGKFHPSDTFVTDDLPETSDTDCADPSCRLFECSSCKKVFGSHQALGGHRATHKNVKGCFAITGNGSEPEDDQMGERERDTSAEEKTAVAFSPGGHRCSICTRVFSSGQALGGHKRCHWENSEDPPLVSPFVSSSAREGCRHLDLNLPPPLEDDYSSSSHSSGLTLDLRLGL